jgi:hypothetical protein
MGCPPPFEIAVLSVFTLHKKLEPLAEATARGSLTAQSSAFGGVFPLL